MAVRPRNVVLPPRELFRKLDPDVFGHSAHKDWFREVIFWEPHDRHTIDSADDWWQANISVIDGCHAYGMPHPSTQSKVKSAYDYSIVMEMDLVRDPLKKQLA